jgi:hypothetical protein
MSDAADLPPFTGRVADRPGALEPPAGVSRAVLRDILAEYPGQLAAQLAAVRAMTSMTSRLAAGAAQPECPDRA